MHVDNGFFQGWKTILAVFVFHKVASGIPSPCFFVEAEGMSSTDASVRLLCQRGLSLRSKVRFALQGYGTRGPCQPAQGPPVAKGGASLLRIALVIAHRCSVCPSGLSHRAAALSVRFLPELFVLFSEEGKENLKFSLPLVSSTLFFWESCPQHFSVWLCHEVLRVVSSPPRALLKEEGLADTSSFL